MNRDSIPPFSRASSRPRRHGAGCNRLPRRNPPPRRSRRERVLVLGPLGLAGTAASCGVAGEILAPLCLAALAWTLLASLGLALLAGLRRGDWSAFRDCDREEDREEEMDLDLRVGAWAFMREREHRFLLDHSDRIH